MKNLYIVVVLIVVVAIGGVLFINAKNKPLPAQTDNTIVEKDAGMTAKDKSQSDDSTMEKKDSLVMGYSGTVLAGSTTPFIAFNKADYDKALSEGKIILLDFYANWCPVCRAESQEWTSAFNNLDVPNAVGFKVNYNDSETDQDEKDLAKQYGVTYQHTKVLLKDGKVSQKVTEQWSASQIKAALEKET